MVYIQKRWFVVWLILMLIAAFIFAYNPVSLNGLLDISAEEEFYGVWGGNVSEFEFGDGSASNPYEIRSGSQLAYLSKTVNEGNGDLNNQASHFILCNDIYLNDTLNWQDWNDISELNIFTPIGSGAYPFNANFDGNNFVVYGVFTNNPDQDYQGLFGYVYNSTIKNLTVSESYISGNSELGGLAGRAIASSFTNCHVSVDIDAILYAGSICGYAEGCSFLNCSAKGSAAGVFSVGGISGFMSNCEVIGCFSYAEIFGDFAGGVTGLAEFTMFSNCFNAGLIFSDSFYGGITGYAESCSYDNLFFLQGISEYAFGGDSSVSFEIFDMNFNLIEGDNLVDRLNDWVEMNKIGTYFELYNGIVRLKQWSGFLVKFNVDTNMTVMAMTVSGGETILAAPAFGYEIDGFNTDGNWYYSDETGEHIFFFGSSGTPVISDMTLYIKWELIAPTVNNKINSLEEVYNDSKTYELSIDFAAVTGISYTVKWYKAGNDGSFTIVIGETETVCVQNVLESGVYKGIVTAYARGQTAETASYHYVTILPAEQNELVFTKAADTIVFDPGNETYHLSVNVVGGSISGPIKYELFSGGTGTGTFESEYLKIITVGTFYFTAKLNGNENYNAAETKEKFVLTVEHANVARPTKISDIRFTGADLTGVNCGFIGTRYLLVSGKISEVNAGKYSAAFSLCANYKWADGDDVLGVHTVNWEIGPRVVTVPNSASTKSYVYSGLSITGIVDAVSTSQYTVMGNCAVNAGSYTTTISLNSKTNYVWSNGEVDDFNIAWTINPFTLSDANATVSITNSGFKYSGTKIEPKVQILAGSLALSETLDYVLSYCNNVESTDTAKILVTGIGNFCGSMTMHFAIGRADLYMDVKLKPETIYDGANHEDVLDVSAAFNENPIAGVFTVVDWDSSVAGQKTFNWRFTPYNTNFNEAAGEITVTITKATLIGLEILSGPKQKTYNAFDSLNINGIVLSAIFTSGKKISVTSGFTVVYQNGGNGFFAGETSVMLNYASDDIVLATAIYGFTVKKIAIDIPPINIGITYNGTIQSAGSFDCVLYTVSGEVEKIDAGSYYVTLTLKDSVNYSWNGSDGDSLVLNWLISKATQQKPEIAVDNFKYSFEGKIQLQFTNKAEGDRIIIIKQLSGFNVAGLVSDGIFTVFNVGNFTLELTMSGNENYEGVTIIKTIIITKGDNPQSLPGTIPVMFSEGLTLGDISLIDNWNWVNEAVKLDVNLSGAEHAVILPSTDLYLEKTGFVTVIVTKGEGSATVKIDNYTAGGMPFLVLTSVTNNINNVVVSFKPHGATDDSYSAAVPIEAGYYTVRVLFNETEKYSKVIATADFTVYQAQRSFVNDVLSVIIEPHANTVIEPSTTLQIVEVSNHASLIGSSNITILTAFNIYLLLNEVKIQPNGMLRITLSLKHIIIKDDFVVLLKFDEDWKELLFELNDDGSISFDIPFLGVLIICRKDITPKNIVPVSLLFTLTAVLVVSVVLFKILKRRKRAVT